ncbi:MAG: YicC family protein [Syntrophobacterales bacterium]|jgi:uncharacterized protein (TIGR00255 family)|nr:YicC family protein [Syntrophobacterales bacterium]
MIKSMTGYGKGESIIDGRKYAVEIRSLNHRYLEVVLRLPGSISALETAIKRKVGGCFSRGRIEVSIRLDTADCEAVNKYELNLPLLRNYHELLQQMRQEFGIQEEITLAELTRFKDIFIAAEEEPQLEGIMQNVEVALNEAMALLTEMRQKEGELLLADLEERISNVETLLAAIEKKVPLSVQNSKIRLMERVRELTEGIDIDEIRLNQEIAIMADKSDITEEIVRLTSHLCQFREMFKSEDAIGRKMDFLIQEMNREANTIGSKTGDLDISRNVIEIKSELGKLKEQVQNIE